MDDLGTLTTYLLDIALEIAHGKVLQIKFVYRLRLVIEHLQALSYQSRGAVII